ncbi:MAG: hypothetical protein ABID54_13360, partial [Pseudomonadota bacterium]
MRIDFELARLIATASVTEPYRQTDVLTTRDFARYLKDRDISLHWATVVGILVFLGLLIAIIVGSGKKEGFEDESPLARMLLGKD